MPTQTLVEDRWPYAITRLTANFVWPDVCSDDLQVLKQYDDTTPNVRTETTSHFFFFKSREWNVPQGIYKGWKLLIIIAQLPQEVSR